MDPQLKARIDRMRKALEKNPDPSIGFLAPPARRPVFPAEVPLPYQDFLREADGAVCGVVTLYESEQLVGQQSICKSLPGGRSHWFCIGLVEEKALVMDVRNNTVHIIDPEEDFDLDESLGELDHALLTGVFGNDYADLVLDVSDDPWYALIREQFPAQDLPDAG